MGSGDRYTLEVTPEGNKDVVVTVAENSATNGTNTGPSSAVTATAVWDAAVPTVGITWDHPRFNAFTGNLTATFTWSEAVTGFVTGDVTVTGGAKAIFTGSGDMYTLEVTPEGNKDVVVTVAENSATDGVNTGPSPAVTATAVWDSAVPTVSITWDHPRFNASTGNLTATFTWSEAVTGFVTGDLTVTSGARGTLTGSDDRYALEVTPEGNKDVVVTVDENSATDGVNTAPPTAVSETAIWDADKPGVTITGVPAKINSTAKFTTTFTWTKDVTNFMIGDVSVIGGTKGGFTGSGDRYTLEVTPEGNKDVVVTVAENSATNGINTGPSPAVTATAVWDAAAPTVGITWDHPRFNASTGNLTASFTWSEAVTGFVNGDLTVTGGTKATFTGSDDRYTLVVTPAGNKDVVVTVAANSVTDGVNTGPPTAVSETAIWDADKPGVTITGVPAKINSTAKLTTTFTWTKDVTNFMIGDVLVIGGTKGGFTGSGDKYTLEVTPAGNKDVVVTVAENSATNGINTGPPTAVTATAVWDAAVPTVGITWDHPRFNASTGNLTATFTWSEAVTGFVTGDLTVTGGTKDIFTGSGDRYTLEVTPEGNKDVVVTVAENSATDGINTGPASAALATAVWDADKLALTIAEVPAKINSTAKLTATFTWSETVTGFVTGDVAVTGGTKGTFTGSGDRYTLEVTPEGDKDVVVTVAENSATDGVNTGPSPAVTAMAFWDATVPTVSITWDHPRFNASTGNLTASFTWSEAVTGFVTGDLTVTGGTKGTFTGSGDRYTLEVTPEGNKDVVVTVDENSATDGINTGPTSAAFATAVWDADAPTVLISGVPAKINSTDEITATFTFSESVTDFVTGDVIVTGGTKGAFSGSGTTYTLPVTPTGGLDVTVEVAANSATNGLNTGPVSAVKAMAIWDATAPTVVVREASATEGDALTFTVLLDREVSGGLTVTPTFTDGTATEGIDYTKNNVDLTFVGTAGEIQTFTVATIEDVLAEGNETFTVSLTVSGTTSTITATDTGTGTIIDNDTPLTSSTVSLSAFPTSVNEGGSITVEAMLSEVLPDAVTIYLGHTPGTLPTELDDYAPLDQITIPGGLPSGSGTIYIQDDNVSEGDERFTVAINESQLPAGIKLGSPSAVEITIEDDDPPPPVEVSLSVSPSSVDEGETVTVTAKLTGMLETDVVVLLEYNNATNHPPELGDYTPLQMITIVSGEMKGTGQIQTIEDPDAEKETFIVSLGQLPPDLLQPGRETSQEVTIRDITSSEVIVNLSADPDFVEEGKLVTVTATLPEAQDTVVTIPLTVTDGTADARDYQAPPPVQIAIKVGERSGTYSILTVADEVAEEDETFTVALGSPSSGLSNGEQSFVKVTVIDDDEAKINVPEAVSVVEGSTQPFDLSLNSEPLGEVVVMMTWPSGTDLNLRQITQTFTPETWQTKRQVMLIAATDADLVDDQVEVLLTVSGSSDYSGISETVSVTIRDTGIAGLVVNPPSVTMREGTERTLEVALTQKPLSPVVVNLRGNAGTDLELSPSSLTFITADWQAPKSVTLTANEDDDIEDDTATLTLTASGGGYVGVEETIPVTIEDNDVAGIVVDRTVTMEEGGTYPLKIRLLAQPSGPVTVNFSGHLGTDLSLRDPHLTFTTSNWNQAQTVTLAAEKDEDYETDTVELNLATSGGGYNGITADVTVTITETHIIHHKFSQGSKVRLWL